MKRFDAYYTPPSLTKFMLDSVTVTNPTAIADFAAGNGQLLKASKHRWTNAEILATDIDENEVSLLSMSEPEWHVGTCNFLNDDSLEQCQVVRDRAETIPLIVLNPPFSCSGSSYHTISIDNHKFHCGTALAFVVRSLRFLSDKGELVAVLPEGCLYSQRDEDLWQYIRSKFTVESLIVDKLHTFENCRPNIAVVKIANVPSNNPTNVSSFHSALVSPSYLGIKVNIFRGKVSVCDLKTSSDGDGYRFVHSTNLQDSRLTISDEWASSDYHFVNGPMVLIHRVGKPIQSKVVLYLGGESLVLSDCVIALKCSTARQAERLFDAMFNQWDQVSKAYKGTGARYITIRSLMKLLNELGCFTSIECETVQMRKSLRSTQDDSIPK